MALNKQNGIVFLFLFNYWYVTFITPCVRVIKSAFMWIIKKSPSHIFSSETFVSPFVIIKHKLTVKRRMTMLFLVIQSQVIRKRRLCLLKLVT